MSKPGRFPSRPPFLAGTFSWKERGYSCGERSLDGEEALRSDNPWLVLSAVLERASLGDHRPVERLRRWISDPTVSPTFGAACLDVIADAGTRLDLNSLRDLMLSGPRELRTEAAQAAQWCGELWLVEPMLDVWQSTERLADRASVEAYLSNLLEPRGGELQLFLGGTDAPGYPLVVREHLRKLLDRHGDDSIAVFHGEPLDVTAWALRLRKQLTTQTDQPWQDTTSILTFRRKFEAYTGCDCETFFDDRGIVQRADVLSVIDRYLNDAERVQMLPGRRFFFGHPVPTILEN